MTIPQRRWPDQFANDELRLQLDFLQFLRQTAVGKVAGLTHALATAAPLATSPRATALGVIKHLTAAERHWISITAGGADLPSLWQGSPDPSWNLSDTDTPQTVIAAYQTEWTRSADALAGKEPADLAADGRGTIRWIMAHVSGVGSEDPIITPEQLLGFTRELQAAGVDWRLTVYGGAEHAFHHPPINPDGSLEPGRTHAATVRSGVGYHPAQAPRAWRDVLDLLAETLGAPVLID